MFNKHVFTREYCICIYLTGAPPCVSNGYEYKTLLHLVKPWLCNTHTYMDLPEETMMFHTAFPQLFAGSIVGQTEADGTIKLILLNQVTWKNVTHIITTKLFFVVTTPDE